MKIFGLLALLVLMVSARGQEEPTLLTIFDGVKAVSAEDSPNDAGEAIDVTWDLPEFDSLVTKYEIFRVGSWATRHPCRWAS